MTPDQIKQIAAQNGDSYIGQPTSPGSPPQPPTPAQMAANFNKMVDGDTSDAAAGPAPANPDQGDDWLSKAAGVAKMIPGVKEVSDSLGTAGYNLGQIAQGKNPFEGPNAAESQVDVPGTVAGYGKLGATLLSTMAGAPEAAGAKGIVGAAVQGAKYGAMAGGGVGAVEGGANAFEAGGSPMDVGKGALTGGVVGGVEGGVAGGVLGAGTGVLSKALRPAAEAEAAQAKSAINDVIAPRLTAREMNAALEKGTVVNPVSVTGKVGTPDFSNDPAMQHLYQQTKDIINPGATATENLLKVRDGIKNISETQVKPFLQSNPVPFHFTELRNYLEGIQPSPVIKSDPAALANFERVKEEALNIAANHLKKPGAAQTNLTDLNDLWEPGKTLDRHINDQLGEATLGTPQYTGIKAAAQAIRAGFRNFMSDSMRYPGQMNKVNMANDLLKNMHARGIQVTPEQAADLARQVGLEATPESTVAADILDHQMDKLHSLFEVRSNLAPKARLEQGTSAVTRYLKAHPAAKSIAGLLKLEGVIAAGSHL